MKNLLLIFVVLLLALPVLATIQPTTVWDIRTTGSNSNGGGFDPGISSPGTDGSVLSPVSCSITLSGSGTTGTATGACVFSSTTNGPGNLVNVSGGAGCTVGIYEIISQSSGTATFDRSMGSSSDVCTAILGGSLLTIAQYITNLSTNNGPIAYLQTGTYTQTSTIELPGTNAIIGYHTAHGDITNLCTYCPTITTATNSTVLLDENGNGATTLQNVQLTNTAGTSSSGITSHASAIHLVLNNVVMSGFKIGVDGITSSGWRTMLIYATEIKSCSVAAVEQVGPLTIDASYIHGNTSNSTTGAVSQVLNDVLTSITRTVIVNNTGPGFVQQGPNDGLTMVSDVIANNSGDGILFSNSGINFFVEDTIIYGNGGFGINWNFENQSAVTLYNNGFGSNTSGNYSGTVVTTTGYSTISGSISLSADPFVNDAGGNYALNSTAGGGAALKAAGVPGVFPGGLTTGYPDIGAAQSSSGSGSGPYGYVQ